MRATDKENDLDRLRAWLATYPGYDLGGNMQVDWLEKVPGSKRPRPSGLVETSRTADILGNVTVENQYNFGLYITVDKVSGDGADTAYDAGWVLDFQRWVQAQSMAHLAPAFGNVDQCGETITAQNGVFYDTDLEGVGIYVVVLRAKFKEQYEVN